MRVVPAVALLLVVAACGSETERHVYKVALEGQSPPEPVKPVNEGPKEPPPVNSAGTVSPAWLRQNLPVEWTAPPGWDMEPSTRPTRIVECTLKVDGPGKSPVQFLILYGGDSETDPMKVKTATWGRWETFFKEDSAPQTTNPDHDGIRIVRIKVHGEFQGYPSLGNSEQIDEPNWTMIGGWIEAPNGSIMFRMQGPDDVIRPNEPKLDQWLSSLKPRAPK